MQSHWEFTADGWHGLISILKDYTGCHVEYGHKKDKVEDQDISPEATRIYNVRDGRAWIVWK